MINDKNFIGHLALEICNFICGRGFKIAKSIYDDLAKIVLLILLFFLDAVFFLIIPVFADLSSVL